MPLKFNSVPKPQYINSHKNNKLQQGFSACYNGQKAEHLPKNFNIGKSSDANKLNFMA